MQNWGGRCGIGWNRVEGVAEEEDCPARQPTSDERAVQWLAPGAHCSVV